MHEIAVEQHLVGVMEAVVNLVELNRLAGVFVLLDTHGSASLLLLAWDLTSV